MPNLLLDKDVQWVAPISIIPRLNTIPRGYQTFQFDDRTAIRALNLPELTQVDHQHLLQLTTGPYIIHRQVIINDRVKNINSPENIEKDN